MCSRRRSRARPSPNIKRAVARYTVLKATAANIYRAVLVIQEIRAQWTGPLVCVVRCTIWSKASIPYDIPCKLQEVWQDIIPWNGHVCCSRYFTRVVFGCCQQRRWMRRSVIDPSFDPAPCFCLRGHARVDSEVFVACKGGTNLCRAQRGAQRGLRLFAVSCCVAVALGYLLEVAVARSEVSGRYCRLRFVCPAMITPIAYGILDSNHAALLPAVSLACQLISNNA